MAGDGIKTTLGIDGEAEFRKALQQANQELRTLQSEMKAVTSSFDANTTAQQKLDETYGITAKQIETQREKQALLQSQLEKVAAKFGENNAETLRYQAAVNNTTAAINELQKDMQNAVTAASAMQQAESAAAEAERKLAEAAAEAAREVAKEAADVATQTENLHRPFQGLQDRVAELKESMTGGARETNALTDAIKKLGLAAAGVKLTKAAVDGVKAIVSAVGDFEQLRGSVDAIFGEAAAATIKENAQKAFKDAGVSATTYMEQATSFSAALIRGLKGDTERAAFLTDQAIKDMSDNANRYGTSIQEVQAVYQALAKGNFQTLDNLRLGFAGSRKGMQDLLKAAQKLTGTKFDINNLADIYEAIHVIQEDMGITGTTFEESTETFTGSLNKLNAAWDNFVVSLGDPTVDAKQAAQDWAEALPDVIRNTTRIVEEIAPALREASPVVIAAVVELFGEVGREVSNGLIDLLTIANDWFWYDVLGFPRRVVNQDLLPEINDSMDSIDETVGAKMDAIGGTISGKMEGITTETEGDAQEVGQTIVDGIEEGFNSKWGSLSSYISGKLSGLASSVKSQIQNAAKTASYSATGSGAAIPVPAAVQQLNTSLPVAVSLAADTFKDVAPVAVTPFATSANSWVAAVSDLQKTIAAAPTWTTPTVNAVNAAGAGTYIEKIEITGYSAQDSETLVADLNRALGRRYG